MSLRQAPTLVGRSSVGAGSACAASSSADSCCSEGFLLLRRSLSPGPVWPLPMEAVNQKYVISDGVRTLEIHPMQGLNHNSNMLIVYFPKERLLVNADLYTPPAQGAQPPMPNANMRSLRANIQRLRLDVERHVPIHGQPGPADQFMKIVGTN